MSLIMSPAGFGRADRKCRLDLVFPVHPHRSIRVDTNGVCVVQTEVVAQ